jgi:hypothetical protein
MLKKLLVCINVKLSLCFQVSTTPWRRIGGVEISSTLSWPRHYLEVSGQLHALAALPQGKNPCYPLDRRLSVPQRRSGRGGEEKYSQPLPGHEPPIIQCVAHRYTTELSWLLVDTGLHNKNDVSFSSNRVVLFPLNRKVFRHGQREICMRFIDTVDKFYGKMANEQRE